MPALTENMCRGSSTGEFDVIRLSSTPTYAVGYCRRCGRMVCLRLNRTLYRHNRSGRDSAWVKWIKRQTA